MHVLDEDYAAGLFGVQDTPCLSLYQPTHRTHPEKQQDPIRFRNLVKELERSLARDLATREIQPLLEPFWRLADDSLFWNHTGDGLAVLGAPGFFRAYRLQRPVAELAVVAGSFHLKPLLRILQSADRFHLLTLSREEVRLYEGNRDALDPVELSPEATRQIDEAPEGDDQRHLEIRSSGPGPDGLRHHGHGSTAEPIDSGDVRFFRAVDRAIIEHYSQPSELPLLLVTLPEHRAAFRQLSHNPMLMAEGIDSHPEALSVEALRERAWQVIEPNYLARLAGLSERFGTARARALGTDDLAEAMRAAVAGRVETLLVEADRNIPGRVNAESGEIHFDAMGNPGVDDLLDDLAEFVLQNGGEVVVVPTERMPTDSGLAVIYRY